MNTSTINHLIKLFDKEGVPRSLSIPFLIHAQGLTIQDVVNQAGCHRSLFGMALRGERRPPPGLRDALKELLGTDLWGRAEVRAHEPAMRHEFEPGTTPRDGFVQLCSVCGHTAPHPLHIWPHEDT